MTVKFHINDNDEAKRCSAQEGNCQFGDVEHYSSMKEAEKGLEARFDNNVCGTVSKKKKKGSQNVVQDLTDIDNNTSRLIVEPDRISAKASEEYAHMSIIKNHGHNGSQAGNDLELHYYSSPAGRKHLKRNMGFKKPDEFRMETYLMIQKAIDDPEFQTLNVDEVLNTVDVAEKIQKGHDKLQNDFYENDSVLLRARALQESRDDELRHYLVNESAKWYNKLSADQQDAVGSLTANAYLKLQYHLGVLDTSQHSPISVFDNTVDWMSLGMEAMKQDNIEEDILGNAFRKDAADFHETVMSAFRDAPLLDEPVITYRGTTMNEVRELLNIEEGLEYDAYDREGAELDTNLVKDIMSGKYDGQEVNKESRLRTIPISTSVNPIVAKNFGEGEVYLEIKRKTSTSPVNNGTWGTIEQEMLSNPLSNYKIVGAVETGFGDRLGVILQLEEIIDES